MPHASMTDSQQSTAHWPLAAGQALRLTAGPGRREIHVLEGRLWLTRDGSAQAPSQDVWLSAGDSLVLDAGSTWVLEAWGSARFQLLVPPAACAPVTPGAWLRRRFSLRRTFASGFSPAL